MVPYADFINHENVDTGFDCIDKDGKTIGAIEDEEKKAMTEEEEKRDAGERRDFIRRMKTDLLELESKIRQKMEEKGV